MLSYSFRTSVSFLALSLSLLSTPLMAMDTEGVSSLSAAARKLTLTEEASWQEIKRVMGMRSVVGVDPAAGEKTIQPFDLITFYSKKYSFSDPKPDPKLVGRFLIDKNREKEGYARGVSLLATEVENGNQDMAQQLHGLLRLNTFTSPDSLRLADFLLERCLQQRHYWAYKECSRQEKQKRVRERRDLDVYHHYFLAVGGDKDMELLESSLKRHNYNPDRDMMKPLEQFHRSNPLEQEQMLEAYLREWGDFHVPLVYFATNSHFPIHPRHQLRLCERAIALNSVSAMHAAAALYTSGFEGQVVDKKKACELLLQAAALGEVNAKWQAGKLLEKGAENLPADQGRALALYLEAAELGGHPVAMCFAATILQQDEETKPKAFELFSEASRLNPNVAALATFSMAQLVEQGFRGKYPDPVRAYELYTQAKDLGNSLALCYMGKLLSEGFGDNKPNPAQAFKRFSEAAKLGLPLGKLMLGLLLEKGGERRRPNPEKALEWIEPVAKLGYEDALYHAGRLLCKGVRGGVSAHLLGLDYLRKAAEKENTAAMRLLAIECARYTDEDHLREAYFWAKKAADLGDEKARQMLDSLVVPSTPEEALPSTSEELSPEDAQLTDIIEDLQKVDYASLMRSMRKAEPLPQPDLASLEGDKKGKGEMPTATASAAASMEEEESVTSEESLEAEAPMDIYGPSSTPLTTNAKTIRARLREAGRLGRLGEETLVKGEARLTHVAQDALTLLLNPVKAHKITDDNLKSLFQDPFFAGQVQVVDKAHGIAIQALHPATRELLSASAHFEHKKKRNNFDPAFLSFIRKTILPAFGLGQE